MIVSAQTPEAAVRALYTDAVTIVDTRHVGGGCINRTRVLELSNGRRLFCKENGPERKGMFTAEAKGLDAMRSALPDGGEIVVPRPLAVGESPAGQFLLMEYVEQGPRASSYPQRLGHGLAALHGALSQRFGFAEDNYIGLNPQINTWTDRWTTFFAEHRLGPQIAWARQRGLADRKVVHGLEQIAERIDRLLPEPAAPGLLHGDLWGGNVMTDPRGGPVLIDPATYYGHPEADIAMTELFGGFAPAFYAAYREAAELPPSYRERRDVYNLYHLLNHLNLFGAGYLGQVMAIVRRFA